MMKNRPVCYVHKEQKIPAILISSILKIIA